MKLSLIVPAYNEEKYIDKLLDSVIKQSIQPDEIVICNNCSTDKTVEVIDKYKKILPIKLVNENHKGINFAVETAWRKATGDLILKTDADSILPNNWVENIVNHFKEDPNLAACGGNFYSSDGNIFIKIGNYIAYPIVDLSFILNRGYTILFGGNLAIKKSILQQINGYIVEDKILPDDQLLCRKLHKRQLKFKRFNDCYNYSSSRRFNSLKSVIDLFLSIFSSKHYSEKSN